jgi:hypothetical protein
MACLSAREVGIRPKVTARVFLLLSILAISSPLHAQTARDSSLDQRVADLEACTNDTARASTSSNIAGPGPEHNAWMMTRALVDEL